MKRINQVKDTKKGMRWWIPVIGLVLAMANILRVRSTAEMDSTVRNMQTMLSGALFVLLLLIWWTFLTRLRWRVRFAGLGLVVICGAGVMLLVRIDGSYDGGGLPRIVWRWAPRKTGEVGMTGASSSEKQSSQLKASLDYPGYLGRERSGIIHGIELERDWTTHPPHELWRRPIGLGWSAFAVSGSYAVTQEQRGQDELVICYELATGQPLWSHTNLVRFSEPMGGDGPRATPTIEGGRVYALGATGILDCLDAATGKLIWTRDIIKENELRNTYFGKCSSPLLADDLVVVTGGMTKRASLLAYRQGDGKLAWSAGHDEASFSSPVLVTLGGKRQILSVNAASIAAHDLKDGHILWEYAWSDNKFPKCTQPVVLDGDRVFLSASFNSGCAALKVNAGGDGNFSVKELWKNRSLKSEISNIVVRDGFLYGLDDGIMVCVDVSTGERKWKDGRYGHGQVLLVNDLLLVQTEQGPVALVEANPAGYREVGRLGALKAKTWNTPALAGEFLLVRNDEEAVCYQLAERSLKAKDHP
jgi:outer membrane protein assembly factor BamB